VRYGYDQTTMKDIAAEAGITSGALYHYFDSKQDIFVAVHRWVQHTAFGEFERAIDGKATLLEQFSAMLDKAAEIHAEDRLLAAFTAISPIEIQRHEELRHLIGDDARTVYRFFGGMVDRAIPKRASADREAVVNMLVALVTGFSILGATTHSARSHRAAIQMLERVLDGGLTEALAETLHGKAARNVV
jgi:AcrR family transcriptional regulator